MKAVAVCILAGLVPAAALAQGGLMDMGKGMLKQEMDSRMGGSSASGASSGGGLGASLSAGEIGSGLKEALRVATTAVTGRLGRADGFNSDPTVHIPLPERLGAVRQGLALAGKSGLLDDLELRLNRAAEAATPKARQILSDAVSKMTLDDARGILNGPKDAATQYFKRTMTPDLKTAMRPMVDQTVSQSGAVQSYQGLAAQATALPLAGDALKAGPGMLTDHVLDYALAGIFGYLAKEEAEIRTNPAQRSTDLLKKVFGG